MKNVCIMQGAVLNAGDYLIDKRAKDLIQHYLHGVNLSYLNQVGIDYSDKVDYLNSFDAILFAGGPLYIPGIYPNQIRFVKSLDRIKVPVFFIGGGLCTDIYGGKFSESDYSFFNLGIKKGVPLGCRCFYTYRYLKHQGYKDIMMTGCPAWYNLDTLNDEFKSPSGINKICVSEPAKEDNVFYLFDLLKHLRDVFPDAQIFLVNHREKKLDIFSNNDFYKALNINLVNISGSIDGFKVYDDCDLHVGFRVHAHIYNLSIRNLSFLFSEDVRGFGINHTLGLESLNSIGITLRKKRLIKNFYIAEYDDKSLKLCQNFDDLLENAIITDYHDFKEATWRMQNYFGKMKEHIEMIGQAIL